MSLWSRLTIIPVVVLAIVNISLVMGFWHSFGGDNPVAFQALGVALVLIEMTALVVASDAEANGAPTRATIWRVIFGLVVVVNLFADFGAVVTRTAEDAAHRAQQRATYDTAADQEREAAAEIGRLQQLLPEGERDKPLLALQAELRAVVARVDSYAREGRVPPGRITDRLASAQSLVATRQAIDVQERLRSSARETIRRFGARPEAEHPQFVAFATLLRSLGVVVDASMVRVWLAVPIAIIMKLVIVFGFWVLTPRSRAARTEPEDLGDEAVPGSSQSTPASRIDEPAPVRPRRARAGRGDALAAALEDLESGRG
jgi:hypothetical protein